MPAIGHSIIIGWLISTQWSMSSDLNPYTNSEEFFKSSRKNPRHFSVEVTKLPLKCSIMIVESAFKDQNTRKFVSFNKLVSNLLCRAKSGVSTQEFLWEQTSDIIVSCELWLQRTPDILVFRMFGAILYVLCCQATLDTIVSTCDLVLLQAGLGVEGEFTTPTPPYLKLNSFIKIQICFSIIYWLL